MADDDAPTTTEQQGSRRGRTRKSSGRKLRSFVHIPDPNTNKVRVFGPDDDVPDEFAEQVTNPKAWDDYELDEPVPSEGEPVPGANQFAGVSGVAGLNLSKAQLYGMHKDELVEMAEQGGVDTSNLTTKQELVEAITAR